MPDNIINYKFVFVKLFKIDGIRLIIVNMVLLIKIYDAENGSFRTGRNDTIYVKSGPVYIRDSNPEYGFYILDELDEDYIDDNDLHIEDIGDIPDNESETESETETESESDVEEEKEIFIPIK